MAASSNITVNSAADMCGHTIAVETGTTEEGDAWAYIGKQIGGSPMSGGKDNCTAAGKQDLKVSSFEKQTDANTALLSDARTSASSTLRSLPNRRNRPAER